MLFELTSISVILFIATVINAIVALIAWQRKNARGGLLFALGISALAFWTLASGLDYAAVPIPLKVLFAKFEYIGYNSAIAFFVLAIISYAGYNNWLKSKWVIGLVWFFPVTNILLAWTNDWHGWLWTGFSYSFSTVNDSLSNLGCGGGGGGGGEAAAAQQDQRFMTTV